MSWLCCALVILAVMFVLLFSGSGRLNRPYSSERFGKDRGNVNWRRNGRMR